MVDEKSCVTPAGTSNELDVQNEWEENTHTHTVEVLVVVRAGVIKLLEYPPDKQGYNWLLPKLSTEE